MTVKAMRDRTGLSQSKFAQIFSIPVVNIQHWEQGVCEPPSYVLYMMEYILKAEGYIEKGVLINHEQV